MKKITAWRALLLLAVGFWTGLVLYFLLHDVIPPVEGVEEIVCPEAPETPPIAPAPPETVEVRIIRVEQTRPDAFCEAAGLDLAGLDTTAWRASFVKQIASCYGVTPSWEGE